MGNHYLPQTANETPFHHTYGIDAMIPIEVGEPLTRNIFFHTQQNKENMKVELDIREEVQEMARVNEEATKLEPQEDTTPKSGLMPFSLAT